MRNSHARLAASSPFFSWKSCLSTAFDNDVGCGRKGAHHLFAICQQHPPRPRALWVPAPAKGQGTRQNLFHLILTASAETSWGLKISPRNASNSRRTRAAKKGHGHGHGHGRWWSGRCKAFEKLSNWGKLVQGQLTAGQKWQRKSLIETKNPTETWWMGRKLGEKSSWDF